MWSYETVKRSMCIYPSLYRQAGGAFPGQSTSPDQGIRTGSWYASRPCLYGGARYLRQVLREAAGISGNDCCVQRQKSSLRCRFALEIFPVRPQSGWGHLLQIHSPEEMQCGCDQHLRTDHWRNVWPADRDGDRVVRWVLPGEPFRRGHAWNDAECSKWRL